MKTMIRLVTIAALSLAVYSCAISNDNDFLGYAPGMNETAEAMTGGDRFDKIAENPFVKTKDQNVSTFSIDADGASYTIMRKYVKNGWAVEPASVRIEEFLNYFTFDYPEPTGSDLVAINAETGLCPWNKEHRLLRLGLKGKSLNDNELPASNYVFLVDVSGSMSSKDKLELLKSSLVTLLDYLQPEDRISIVTYQGDFNYSAVNDLGASYASGEYILLLNNDTEVITANWMEEMLMYAQREDVGAVGAKLYYADKTIQHAGVVIGLGAHRTAGHTHYRIPVQNLGYMGRLCYTQNVTAVTGACLLVKKSLYEQVGGLDESFVISLNDVDFCLKLRKLGLLNVWTPFAELYHYESISRGLDDQGEKAERYNRESGHFREKWKAELEAGDPYYNPNFSLDRSDYALKDPAVSGR